MEKENIFTVQNKKRMVQWVLLGKMRREVEYDAKEKSGNEYEDGKKGRYEKKNKSDGKVFLKGHNIADFDIKI